MTPTGGGDGDPAPHGNGNGNGWIHGILTGAEKFLNAVIGSDTPSSSSSSSSSSDSASSEDKEEEENGGGKGSVAISTTRNDEFNQMGSDSKTVDGLDQDLAIVSEIDAKQAIEHLLMEETFSREECNNLVNLIQSRIIHSDEQPISWEKDQTPPPKSGSSLLSPRFLSLGSSPKQTRNLGYTAINEAKKWLEAKKSPQTGPCMLNTNLEFDPQTGSSPVEVARAYMNSLPEKNCTKVFKRGFESSASGVPPERTKRVKLMLIEGSVDIPKFKQLDVNSTVQSSYQAQASIGVNDTPILTAIPLNPADLHVSKSYQIYDSSKGPHNTVPYVTCATDVPEIQPGGCVPSPEMCSTPQLILQDDITASPNASRRGRGRGGRTSRGRGKSRGTTGVAPDSSGGIAGDNSAKGSEQKSPTTRRGRGRGRGRGAKTPIVGE